MVYNAYTTRDVKHLIEYLAENNRDGRGRRGNKIYQCLVENPKKWPWGKNHPWQSWRDHYIKDDVKFDKKIRIYQREHGISTEAQEKENEDRKATKIDAADTRHRLVQEEEASSSSPVEKESICSKKRAKGSPLTLNKKRQKLMKEERDVRGPPLPKEGSNAPLSAGHPPAENEIKAELTHPDSKDTKDYQVSNQVLVPDKQIDPASPSEMSTRQVIPPVGRQFSALARKIPMPSQSDASFDSLFDADSDILVPDSDEGLNALQPGGTQYSNRQRDDVFQSSSNASTSTGSVHKRNSPTSKRHPLILVEEPFKTKLTGKVRKPDSIGDDADLDPDAPEVARSWSPNRTKPRSPGSQKRRANKHRKFKHDSSDFQEVMDPTTGVITDHRHENKRSHSVSDSGPIVTLRHLLSKDVELEPSPTSENDEDLVSNPHTPPSAGLQRSIINSEDSHTFPSAGTTRSQRPMVEDIYNSSGFGNIQDSISARNYRADHPEQGASEDSRAISQASQNGRHVDFHEERKRRRTSRRPSELLGSPRSTSVPTARSISHARQSPISIQLSAQDQSLVTTLGIQQAIAMMSKNHGFTEDVVSRILENVNSIPRADEILREMRVKAEEIALNHLMIDESRIRRSSQQRKREPSRASRKFEIRTVSDDEMSDYSPPSMTRAGQFSRLVEQGRHEEAYAREARRASAVASPVKPASNNSNVENDTRSPFSKSGPTAEPKAVDDAVFLDKRIEIISAEVVEETVEDTTDLQDAHAAMALAFEQHESKLSPQHALRRFQQAASIVKQVLIDHQGHS